ncbi:MAG: cation:proton antiporter [Cyanobacteria bacterium P01_H01_bin.58]
MSVLHQLAHRYTLLAYPILQRLGIARNKAITVTVGATIFTDISALLVLAVCVAVHQGQFSGVGLVVQLGLLAVYAWAVLVGVSRLGEVYFRRHADEGSHFLFVFLVLFVAAVGAQIIQVENIVGAFLAGLAISDAMGRRPIKEKVEFVGNILFVPFFFVMIGTLIAVPVFLATIVTETALVLAIVLGLAGSKFVAAWVVQQIYRYTWTETAVMWSLSLPQVAATLAAALVGVQAGLLDEPVFNSVVVLMLFTSLLGPVLTQQYALSLVKFADVQAGDALL